MGRLPGTMVIPLSHLGKWLPFKKLWGKHVCLPIPVGWNGASSDHYYANIDLHNYMVWGFGAWSADAPPAAKRPLWCWSEERWLDLRATLVLHLRLKRFRWFVFFIFISVNGCSGVQRWIEQKIIIGLMVSATILFLLYGHVSNGNAHNKDEAQWNES